MDYGFKPTTHGRAVLAACLAQEKPPEITRVLFGSGLVAEDVNLADVHELLQYVAEGTIADRRHQDDHFHFTIQYANQTHPGVQTFFLSEFIVYIRDPETGEETDLLYGTLGDYRFAVPEYHTNTPPSVFNLPLVLVISDEVTVQVSATPGLVTFAELFSAVQNAVDDAVTASGYRGAECIISTVSLPVEGWKQDPDATDDFLWYQDIRAAKAQEGMSPGLYLYPESMGAAVVAGMCETAQAANGYVRAWARRVPTKALSATLVLIGESAGSTASIVTDINLPAEEWTLLEDDARAEAPEGFYWQFTYDLAEAREAMVPSVHPHKESLSTVSHAQVCESAATMYGAVRLWAKYKPEANIAATLVLLTKNGSGTSKTATATTAGDVRVPAGSGLTVDEDGDIAVDFASTEAVKALFEEE